MKKEISETEIKNTTKGKLPSLLFTAIKNFALGENYELSLVFIGDKLSQKLNNQYRDKNKPADILSFPLTKTSGEIFINLRKARKDAKNYDRNPENFIAFLFIHGLIHLKGFEHSSKMELQEKKIREKFKI